MPKSNKTQILTEHGYAHGIHAGPIYSDVSAILQVIKSNSDSKTRKDAAIYLLKLVEEHKDIDEGMLAGLFNAEKDIGVATELKRVLNKLQIRHKFSEDPTSKYDKKLSSTEKAKLSEEIDRLKRAYDNSSGKEGDFERKYKVIEKIADGGMGRIYKAVRHEDNLPVAIKFLLLEELSKNNNRERIITRFRREGKILRSLDHPNIVRACEYGETNGEQFLVLEYIDGGTVEDMINGKSLNLNAFRVVSLQLCDAVEHIHKNGVIHRDIKPANILVTNKDSSMQIKLTDFGLAKDKKDAKISRISFQAGTDEYSSPQQLEDARYADERDDIYSIGKTFYEMLTGKIFKNDEPYKEIAETNFRVPKELDIIIKKCIAYRKEDRFQTVSDLRKAITENMYDVREESL